MKIGITCYPTYGGSGVVATELGKGLAKRGHQIHFISYAMPMRLDRFMNNIFYHEVEMATYPLFEFPLYTPALASKMVEVQRDMDITYPGSPLARRRILGFDRIVADRWRIEDEKRLLPGRDRGSRLHTPGRDRVRGGVQPNSPGSWRKGYGPRNSTAMGQQEPSTSLVANQDSGDVRMAGGQPMRFDGRFGHLLAQTQDGSGPFQIGPRRLPAPVQPGDLVVLAIGVVVAPLSAAELVARDDHRTYSIDFFAFR